MKFLGLILFLLLCQMTAVFAAPIKVDVDRKTVNLNESFQITFSTTEDPDANPDFSPLEKEFEIIDRNHGSTSSWVNGASNTTIQWTFNVMAKRTGQVEIPALHFGSETSPALVITVTEANQQNEAVKNTAELFLEAEATPKETYLQSQVIYTLRFFRRVNIAEARLKDLELADAVVTKLEEDKNYKTQLHGQDYVVTERSYAVFPQKSGEMTIPALTLTAAVLAENQPDFDSIFGTRSTRTERVSSKPITLKVLPIPTAFKGHWLAAQQLELKQQWSGDVTNMKVGEPLTRTLTLVAKGATTGQLPQLHQNTNNEDLKNYPDQPHTEEQKNSDGIVAIREEKIAFIPAKAGTYTLPAVEIPWFNVKTKQQEIAKIPAMTVMVTGVANVPTTNPQPPVDKSVENIGDKPAVINKPVKLAANPQPKIVENHFWQWLTAFFALAWLATLLFFFINKKTTSAHTKHSDNSANSVNSDSNTDLKKACINNDAIAAKQALMAWGKAKYQVLSLGAIADFCDARLRDEILLLNQHLYSQQAQTWDGKRLFQTFSEHIAMEKARPKQDDKLEPLHRI